MSKNVYDIFRDVQKKRTECYDGRSAAFIMDGKMAKQIWHKRKEEEIPAALVFRHKEGPDEVLVYTFIKDELQKADYFVYENVNYLVYETNKLTDDDITYKKQKAVECNVSFNIGENIYTGYFMSSVRRKENPDFEGRQVLMPDEMPLLILPTNNVITINTNFVIEGKPWNVVEYDNITNKGITYYYIERYFNTVVSEEEVEVEPTVFVENEVPVVQEPIAQIQTFGFVPLEESVSSEDQIENLNSNIIMALRPMIDYVFTTEDAFFAATPSVDIASRKKFEVTFKVPFGISQVVISTKVNGQIVEKIYQVVL